MDGIDRKAIDAIILEVSGNSAFMQQQRQRDAAVNAKIESLRQAAVDPHAPQHEWSRQQQQWIAARSRRSLTVVVDMDMFYMACELLGRPDITDTTPAAVGGSSMILTSNYAARRYGVRSAMPGYIGTALVERLSGGTEQLVFCKSNFELYKEKSGIVQGVLQEFDPYSSMLSLDEAALDLSHYLSCRLQHPDWSHQKISTTLADAARDGGNYQQVCSLEEVSNEVCLQHASNIVTDIRRAVFQATGGLTCSAGLAPNRLLAKIASDHNKPNGQCIVGPTQTEITAFLHPLAIRKVCGIGRVTEKILKAFGITTVQDIFEQSSLVSSLFEPTSKTTEFLLRASLGCSASDGEKQSTSQERQKGISRSRTFQPIPWSEVATKIEDIAQMLADDMQRKKLKARTVSLVVKFDTFATLSKGKTQTTSVSAASEIARAAMELRSEMGCQTKRVRLVGISCTNLDDQSRAIQSTMDRFLRTDNSKQDVNVKPTNPYLSPKRSSPLSRNNQYSCPLCQRSFPSESDVSNHIEMCLNGPLVRQMIQEENVKSLPKTKRTSKQSLLKYFNSNCKQS